MADFEQYPERRTGIVAFKMRDGRSTYANLCCQLRSGNPLTQPFLPQEENDLPFDGVNLGRA